MVVAARVASTRLQSPLVCGTTSTEQAPWGRAGRCCGVLSISASLTSILPKTMGLLTAQRRRTSDVSLSQSFSLSGRARYIHESGLRHVAWTLWQLGSRKYLLASLDQSLNRMGLDYVDIFYSHRPDPETPVEETMAALNPACSRLLRKKASVVSPFLLWLKDYFPIAICKASGPTHERGDPRSFSVPPT